MSDWLDYEYSTAVIDRKPTLLRRGGTVRAGMRITDLAWHPVLEAGDRCDVDLLDLVKRVAKLLNRDAKLLNREALLNRGAKGVES